MTCPYKEISFLETEISFKKKNFKYYSSPILHTNEFKHGFFNKSSSKKYLPLISTHFNKNYCNCFLNQVHSNNIVIGSITQKRQEVKADGLVCDQINQNLWIYTADCMPILFADRSKRFVAAIHCGRRGLEKRIIKNLIKIFDKLGSSRDELLVAIGPSISKKHYLVDKKTLEVFHSLSNGKIIKSLTEKAEMTLDLLAVDISTESDLFHLDLKKYAYLQLLNENIPEKNIEISNLCTYNSEIDFNSWRRTKTTMRQWSFISSY